MSKIYVSDGVSLFWQIRILGPIWHCLSLSKLLVISMPQDLSEKELLRTLAHSAHKGELRTEIPWEITAVDIIIAIEMVNEIRM